MKVKKASGELVEFDERKLIQSLMRAGANEAQAKEVLNEISELLVEGMSTRKIYGKAYKLLRQYSSHFAARYHLKQGVLQLGPSGYAFEQLIGRILTEKGFHAQNNVYMKGKCVDHEIDVWAVKDQENILVECKFKNTQGLKADVKLPLYIHSRDNDVREGELKGKDVKGWIVTNTEFSEDAIRFGKCSGMHLVSWKYPFKGNLRDLIEETGSIPITCLSTLSKKEKEALLEKNIILLKTLVSNPGVLNDISLNSQRNKMILTEANALIENYV